MEVSVEILIPVAPLSLPRTDHTLYVRPLVPNLPSHVARYSLNAQKKYHIFPLCAPFLYIKRSSSLRFNSPSDQRQAIFFT